MFSGRSGLKKTVKTRIQSLQKHHRFVHIMRILLPILAGGLLLSLLIWPQLMKKADFVSDVLKSSVAPLNSKAQIDMKKVQFYSEDDKGQPFTLTSDKILEVNPEKRLVQMDNPYGEMTLNSGVKIFSDSPVALFYQDSEVVYFKKDLHFKTDNGYTATSSDVVVDYKNQLAYSNAPIYIRGEKADLDATAFYMRQNGEEIDFKGFAKVILKDPEQNKNVVITADRAFEIRQKTQTITAFENVLADDGTNKVYSDEMTAYFTQVSKNKYKLKSVQAQKNVKIVTKTETVTGNDAFYDLNKKKAFITGDVVVQRAEGEMMGDRAVIDMQTGHSQLETDYTKTVTPHRVKGTIYPTRIQNKGK